MNNYSIELKKNNDVYSENFKALSFPEAAARAYMLRNHKGYDWEITSIEKSDSKDKLNGGRDERV